MQNNSTHMPSADELQLRIQEGKKILYAGGQKALGYFTSGGAAVELKSDSSPVTIADRESEELMRQLISTKFPEDGILGEEHGDLPSKNSWQWILDPIDGTRSFIHGVPLWGSLMALRYGDQIVGGIAYMPVLDEMIFAAPSINLPTHWIRSLKSEGDLDGQSIEAKVANDKSHLKDCLWCHTSPDYFADAGCLELHHNLQKACGWTRAWSDCYAFVLLATGRVDIVVEPELNLWDVAPFIPLIEGAGGKVSQLDGTNLGKEDGKISIAAASPQVHGSLIELIKESI